MDLNNDPFVTEMELERALDLFRNELGDDKLVSKLNEWLINNNMDEYEISPKHESIIL